MKMFAGIILALTALAAFSQNRPTQQSGAAPVDYEARVTALEGKIKTLETRIRSLETKEEQSRIVLTTPTLADPGGKTYK